MSDQFVDRITGDQLAPSDIAGILRDGFVTEADCRWCDNTGDIPGVNMSDASRPCYRCGRGRSLADVLRILEMAG